MTTRTQYYTAASLDGFIADADHGLEWLFALGEPSESSYPAFLATIGAAAMGASTYEWLLRHAIHAEPPQPGCSTSKAPPPRRNPSQPPRQSRSPDLPRLKRPARR
jgi:dihydrofolate reductase